MQNNITEIFSRNVGLITEKEQALLANTCIAIAGVGGDGGLLAERLVRFGIGKLILADPEIFEMANLNRQFAANKNYMGKNKAVAVAMELLLINPNLKVNVYTDGITKENVKEIVQEANIIVDELEYTLPELSVMLHREARKNNKHVFMGANIGWGASMFCFAPGGKTFEEHFSYDEKRKTIDPLAYLKKVPSYLKGEIAENVLSGKMPMPALASSVSLVASVIASEVIFFVTGKREPVTMPHFLFIDLFELSINKS